MEGSRFARGVLVAVSLAAAAGGAEAQWGRPTEAGPAQPPGARARLEARLGERLALAHERGTFPGGSAALVLPGGEVVTACVGVVEEGGRAVAPRDRMLAGSVGKTFVAAAALRLVRDGELELDGPAARWLGGFEGFGRLSNADTVTVRQLLRHESGLPRYVLERSLWEALLAEPDRAFSAEELLARVFDAEPLFAPGEGWAYSDTNYLVVGLVIEAIEGRPWHAVVRERFLEPHGLADTMHADRRVLPGLVQGHDTLLSPFGFPERVLDDQGRFAVNPVFEGCGGGFVSTPTDLARWASVLFAGEAFEGQPLAEMLDTVPAEPLGPGARYGIGVIERRTELGPFLGHDGTFPGYGTTMGLFPELDVAVAIQVNRDGACTRTPLHGIAVDLARIARDVLRDERPR